MKPCLPNYARGAALVNNGRGREPGSVLDLLRQKIELDEANVLRPPVLAYAI